MNNILLPSGIDWLSSELDGIDVDLAKVAVSFLYRVTTLKERLVDDDRWWYEIDVSRKKWVRLLGDGYLKVLTALEKMGVIVRGKSYKVGERCKVAYLTEDYRHQPFMIDEIAETKFRTFRRFDYEYFRDSYGLIKDDTDIPYSVYQSLLKCVHDRLGIDISDEELEVLKSRTIKKSDTEVKSLGNADLSFVAQIRSGVKSPCSIGVEGHRFFSPVTQMFRLLRPYLKGDGQPLVEIDIRSSQPVFIWSAVRKWKGVDTEDLNEWKKHLEEGTLYEQMMEGLGLDPSERDLFKGQHLFPTLYGPNVSGIKEYTQWRKRPNGTRYPVKVKKDGRLFDWICQHYNTVGDFMWETKNEDSIKKDDYKEFVMSAQREESAFMLGKVVRNLLRKNRHMCLFTIHDSILCKGDDVKCVIDELISQFSLMNIQPMLTVNDYSLPDTEDCWTRSTYRNTHFKHNMTSSFNW